METDKGGRRLAWVKTGILILLLAGATALLWNSNLCRFFLDEGRILEFLSSLGPWAFAGFIFLQAAQVVVAPIPGDVTGFLGGYIYGPLLGTVLSTIGLTIGSCVAFALSRAFGRPFVARFVPKAAMNRFDYLLHHKGAFVVFLLFLIPSFPKDYLCYILGLGHLTMMEFLVIGGVGRLFGTLLLTLEGNFIRLHQYVSFSIVLAVALILLALTFVFRERLERSFRLWHLRTVRKRRTKVHGPAEQHVRP